MKYNDGGKKDPVNIKDKEAAIIEFAEGNKSLEALLKYCFDNGILTEACCKGHGDNLNPYISFYICKENEIYIKNIIDKLLEKGYHLLYKSSRLMLPSLTISTNTVNASNLFNTLLNIFKNSNNIELNGLKKKIYRIYANTSNNDTTLDIKKVDDKYDANIYFDFDFERVVLDENELMNTLDKKLRLSRIDINNDIGFKEYNPNQIQERIWSETKYFLEDNNIKFKDNKKPDFINIIGAYGKNTNPDLELVVEKDDDISIVANKLELLKKKFIDAKAVLNGIELSNVVIQEKTDNRDKIRYINIFNKEDCIEYYNKEILRFVDKYLFNEELIILKDNPLCLSFDTNTLTDDEIASRLLELKRIGIDAWFKNGFIEINIKNIINKESLVYEIKRNKRYGIKFSIMKILSSINNINIIRELLNIYYRTLDSNTDSNKLVIDFNRVVLNNGLDLKTISDNYYLESQKNKDSNIKYDNYLLFKALRRILDNDLTYTQDDFIKELNNDLKETRLDDGHTEYNLNEILIKYKKYIETVKKQDLASNFRI